MIDTNKVFKLKNDLLISDKFSDDITVIFTTSKGGFSKGNFATNNLALHLQDQKDNVMQNRQTLANKINTPLQNFVFAAQNHGINIKKVDKNDCGKGVNSFEDGILDTDCLYTYEKNVPLACFYADCTPIYFYEPQKKLIGVIHAGWQGTVKNIVKEVVVHLKENEKIDITKLKVIIGPNIKKESFEVKEDVYKLFKDNEYTTEDIIEENNKGEFNIDIVKYNENALIKNGVLKENIYISSLDTFKEEELFSFRRNNETGRMLAVIKL